MNEIRDTTELLLTRLDHLKSNLSFGTDPSEPKPDVEYNERILPLVRSLQAMIAEQKLEERAEVLYEQARRHVAGRARWKDLNPRDPYDMGMRNEAIRQARETT